MDIKKINNYSKFIDENYFPQEDRIIICEGEPSYTEGLATEASGEQSHAEGILTIAFGECSHAEGKQTEANGHSSHSEGYLNISTGDYSHSEGMNTTALGSCSHCEGYNSKSVGDESHAEGSMTNSIGTSAHSEGSLTKAIGIGSHAEGWQTTAKSNYSHAEGILSSANGCGSHAQGYNTIANGSYSHSSGYETIAQNDYQTVIGKYNKPSPNLNNGLQTDDAFIIGNGDTTNSSNALRVTFEGNIYSASKSAYHSGGADYAEMFEWIDSNINVDDRVGYFVTLEEDKIRIANNIDDYILGVISTTPSVIGDSYNNHWRHMYLEDEWGRVQYEYIDETDDNYNNIEKNKRNTTPKINPLYDKTKEYVPRKERVEWATVGMLGKILVRDDGTCLANGYCLPNNIGIATASQYGGYRVLKRLSANQILILFR